ncbi:NAD-dependent epimerase/dehydratase family protein [Saccharibacillus sp. JS10]|uniref:NAD-dependent epimerase/dehydratase family protein n=1 Tax=Saccharibacillus sp. JS10 TaxID=2950552 RepID=UPI00210E914A|nr:NAD-dependent epimerase/dehydratase family protein [Saccharibacillus sp. JS10]MCQ4088798.1 ATP-grasp domain-containing protein [Saccharibacillus sp. JS10]
MLKGKRVFVSGGAGVIGTELVQLLLKQEAIIFVGDLKPRPANWSSDILYRQGDLNEITREELLDFNPEYFFHLAATFERSEESYEFWEENERHNLRLSHHLMDCLKDNISLRKVIFASSYLIYDPNQYQLPVPSEQALPLKEDNPIYPRNMCGAAKLMHEIELRFLEHFSAGRLQTVSARIYRVYGKNSKDIVSRWIQSLLKGETLRVFGKEGMFDYIYAGDVAEGLLRLALSEANGIVNLGNARSRRVEEVLEILKQHFPDMRSIEESSSILFEASEAEMSRFEQLTGWKPARQLEDTIPELIRHYQQREEAEVKMPESKAVLVTSASKKVPMLKAVGKSIRKTGKRLELIGGDLDKQAISQFFVDSFWQMPRLTDLNPDDLVEACKARAITSIIPSRDGELAYFAAHKDRLASHGINVMVSNSKTVNLCLDKLLFAEYGIKLGFPVIPASKKWKEEYGDHCVVKERHGAGSQFIGLNLTREEAEHHANSLKEPIFQPLISGVESSIDVYVQQNGKCKGSIARRRELVVNGESQITTTFRDEKLEALCADFAEQLGIYGHAIFQVITDDAGDSYIVECNSRFGGASTLSVAAGLDSFYWFLLESSGADLGEYAFVRSEVNKRLVRYAEDSIQ